MSLWITMCITLFKLIILKIQQVFHKPIPTLFTLTQISLAELKYLFPFIHKSYKESYYLLTSLVEEVK